MNETRRNLYVGLFVLVGLGALGTLVVLFGQGRFWVTLHEAYTLQIQFEKAAGIKEGTQLTVGGKPIGHVRSVDFADQDTLQGGVIVTVLLDAGRQLRRGAWARTIEPGLGMGRPPIEVYPGPPSETLLESGSIIRGEIRSAVDSLLPAELVANVSRSTTQIGDAAQALTPVLRDLHGMLERRSPDAVDQPGGPTGNMSSAITRFDDTLRHFNDVFGDPEVKVQLVEAVQNLHAMSVDGRKLIKDLGALRQDFGQLAEESRGFVTQAQQSLVNVEGQVTDVAQTSQEALQMASRLLTNLNTLAERIQSGEGTIGRVINDGRLYDSLVLTFERLALASEEMRLLLKDWKEGKIRVGL